MVLTLRIRFFDMKICTILPMSSLPAMWIVAGCVLLLLAVVMAILFVLKAREVAMLKKQCEDLRETMRMMRYEEANLSRMLHTVDKAVAQPAVQMKEEKEEHEASQDQEREEEATAAAVVEGCPEVEEQSEFPESSELSEPSESSEGQAESIESSASSEEQSDSIESSEAFEEELAAPAAEATQPQKQSINERRPAIPTDLFAAWFAENEEESGVPMPEVQHAAVQLEAADAPVDVGTPIAEPVVEIPAVVEEPESEAPLATEEVAAGMPLEPTDFATPAGDEAQVPVASMDAELSKEDERFCRKLERIVTTRLRNPNLNIDIIAAQFGIGRTNFYRKVRELTGFSPNDYLKKCRMERAAELLRTTETTISEVCAQVGIPDAQYFSRVFKSHFGTTPSAYRERVSNEKL
jgi:AraC-like DNA-binding protein